MSDTPAQFHKLQPLQDRPPALPDGIFEGWLGDFVLATAEATETPVELSACFALAAIATAVQRRFCVSPEAGYCEPLNIYTASFLPSGSRKSAVLKRFLAPIVEYEREKATEMRPRIARMDAIRKTKLAQIKALQDKAARGAGEDCDHLLAQIADMEADLPNVSSVPQLLVQDVTPEHLGTVLSQQGERLSLFSDEGGVFDTFAGRYNNGLANLDLILQAHDGSPVRVGRATRSIALSNPTLTIGVSPQPQVASELAKKKGFRDRGLLARFLFTWPKSNLGERTLRPRPTDEAVTNAYCQGLRRLLDLSTPETPTIISLSAGAYIIWKEFQRGIEKMMAPGNRLSRATDFGSKIQGMSLRLAGLLHMTESHPGDDVAAATMARAVELGEFFLEHALFVIGQTGADAALQAASRLWAEIDATGQEIISARAIWQPTRQHYPMIQDAEPGFQRLIDRGWIVELPSPEGKRGRPTRRFQVNPAVNIAHIAHGIGSSN